MGKGNRRHGEADAPHYRYPFWQQIANESLTLKIIPKKSFFHQLRISFVA